MTLNTKPSFDISACKIHIHKLFKYISQILLIMKTIQYDEQASDVENDS